MWMQGLKTSYWKCRAWWGRAWASWWVMWHIKLRVVRHNNGSDTKYAINTVMIACLGTNRKTIQVHTACIKEARLGCEWWTGSYLEEFSTVWGPPYTGGLGQTASVAPPTPRWWHCARWQLVVQGYVIGLTTLNHPCTCMHIHLHVQFTWGLKTFLVYL